MKKRLICLTLSMLMLLTCVLTGCSSKDRNQDPDASQTDNSAKTITMWVVTKDETTEEAEKLVNEAFAKITKSQFNTNVVIRFCTEDEYYEKLEEAITATQADIELEKEAKTALRKYLRAHKKDGKTDAELTKQFYIENPQYAKFQKVEAETDVAVDNEDETVVNEYGVTEIKYPDPKENQVDIFYLSGYDKYMEYYDAQWLSSLSDELTASSKKLTDYISTSLLSGVQIDGDVYAIPNNVMIGEYTYMMIDKSLFDHYYQKIDKVENVLDLETFLNDVNNYNQDNGKGEDDEGYVVPLASSYSECLKMLCWYWDLSYIDRSVYETYYDEATGRTYALKNQEEIKKETTDDKGNTTTITQTVIMDAILPDVLYKVNENGQYLDADGNVLNYSYETDTESGWLYNVNKKSYTYSERAAGALYLVDENGMPITPENDKRVKVEAKTEYDSDGHVRPSYYYSFDKNSEFSILGAMMKDADDRSRGEIVLGFNSLFTDDEYHDLYATLNNYQYQGYYGDVKDGQTAAVSFLKGDARIKQAALDNDGVYKDADGKEYYVVVAEYPEATQKELYGNMFAVYANSSYLSRSMEVITYLNTNKELRNLLQYGIEGQHYELNDNGTVRLISNEQYGTYRMDLEKTGNCFITTPTEELGADVWTYAKIQNNDSLIDPLMGFDFNTATANSDYNLDVDLIDHIDELNAKALKLIHECSTKDELLSLMADGSDSLSYIFSASVNDAKLNKATNPNYDPNALQGGSGGTDKSGSSPYTVYREWLDEFGYAPKG